MMKKLLKAIPLFFIFLNTNAECIGKDEIKISTKDMGNIESLISSKIFNQKNYDLPAMHKGDNRKVRTKSSPSYLAAVGSLNGMCSANLVGNDTDDNSRVVTTAYHCIDDFLAADQPITISFITNSGKYITRTATVYDKGDLIEDRAILVLDEIISHKDISPLVIGDVSMLGEGNITVAGYSSDKEKGKGGKYLTYDEDCKHTTKGTQDSEDYILFSNCSTYGGASGGSIIYIDESDDTPYLIAHTIKSDLNGITIGYGYVDKYYMDNSFLTRIYDAVDEYNRYDEQ